MPCGKFGKWPKTPTDVSGKAGDILLLKEKGKKEVTRIGRVRSWQPDSVPEFAPNCTVDVKWTVERINAVTMFYESWGGGTKWIQLPAAYASTLWTFCQDRAIGRRVDFGNMTLPETLDQR